MHIRFLALTIASLPFAAAAQTGTAYVPKAVELAGLSPAEATANQIWNLRGALNVAALQCQFSPFLHIVARYNGMIHQHSRELERANKLLGSYFLRVNGPGRRAVDAFDRYNTRLSQSYSTLDAQYAFCNQAATAGRNAVVQPISRLGEIAQAEVTALRASLTPEAATLLTITTLDTVVPEVPIDNGKRGRRR